MYYSDRNHDIVLFDYCLLLLTDWLSDISQKAYCKLVYSSHKKELMPWIEEVRQHEKELWYGDIQ